jgi:hypothetical protein
VLLRIVPAEAQVVANEVVDVAVEVVDVQNLNAFDLALTFDAGAVEVVDADPNLPGVQAALGMLLDPGFVIINQADNAAGSVHLAMTQLNPSTPKSGTGTLMVVRLRGKQPGTSSTVTIVNGQLAQPDGVMIPTAPPSGGVVSVVASGGGTPTSTPMPTQGAGTPMPTPLETIPALPPTLTPTASPEAATPNPTRTGAPQFTSTPVAAGTTPTLAATAAPATAASATAAAATGAASPTPAAPSATASTGTQPPATVVVRVQATPEAQSTTGTGGDTRSRSASAALWIGVGAFALAVVAGATALVLWLLQRRSTRRGSTGRE